MTKLPKLVRASIIRREIGLDGPQLRRLHKLGVIPGPCPGTRLYDLKAINDALDRAGGLEATLASQEEEMIREARKWGKSA